MSDVLFMNVAMTNFCFRRTSTTSNEACIVRHTGRENKISTLCAIITSKFV